MSVAAATVRFNGYASRIEAPKYVAAGSLRHIWRSIEVVAWLLELFFLYVAYGAVSIVWIVSMIVRDLTNPPRR
jgi:hypothetical protein